jgi:hypothetical protein
MFVGDAYRQAIGQYYEGSPRPQGWPKSLEQLLKDERFAFSRRHLRRLPRPGYRQDWATVERRRAASWACAAFKPPSRREFPCRV